MTLTFQNRLTIENKTTVFSEWLSTQKYAYLFMMKYMQLWSARSIPTVKEVGLTNEGRHIFWSTVCTNQCMTREALQNHCVHIYL